MSMTDVERRRMIEARRKGSLGWQIIHFFGSLGWAIGLLVIILVACATATIVESRFDTRVAQAYIYKAPWFLFWLTMLCVNLFAVTLTRWPWQRKHTGFIVTHAGIITLLIGAMVGQKAGFEASVVLQRGQPAFRLISHETVLSVASPKSGSLYMMPLDVEARPPKEGKPRVADVPETDLKIEVLQYTEGLRTVEKLQTAQPGQEGAPGVELHFHSDRMGQEMSLVLSRLPGRESTNPFFGLATLELLDEMPEIEAPQVDETFVVLSGKGNQNIGISRSGVPSGYQLSIVPGENGGPKLQVSAGSGVTGERLISESLNRPFRLDGKELDIEVEEYWPDFAMENGRPVSRSEIALNPAVRVRIRGKSDGAMPSSPVAPGTPPPLGDRVNKPSMKLVVNRDGGSAAFRLSRGSAVYNEGVLKPGEPVFTGWADWSVELRQALPKAVVSEVTEDAGKTPPANPGEERISGIYAKLTAAGYPSGDPVWIRSGTNEILLCGDQGVRVGFGLQALPIPFSIMLEKFEVPRDEGTETPSNFISTVRFENPVTKQTHVGHIEMNHPASFPPDAWRQWTGFTYKFSQASWNPENLDETTLQVLYDPGWSLKWIGSLMICAGIAIMFYMKPYSKKKGPGAPAGTQSPKKEEALATL